jgi:hypothetical protein
LNSSPDRHNWSLVSIRKKGGGDDDDLPDDDDDDSASSAACDLSAMKIVDPRRAIKQIPTIRNIMVNSMFSVFVAFTYPIF